MKTTVRDAVLDAGRVLDVPESVVGAFLQLLRPCVHLCPFDMLPEELRADARPVGRVAGAPRLPRDMTAPADLPHVLTVDCAALPVGSLDIDFPSDGHLVVFAEISDYPGEGAVVHVPAGVETVEDDARDAEDSHDPELHEPFPLYAVPGSTMPDLYSWSGVTEAVEYAGGDAERTRRVDRLVGEIDKILYGRWSDDIQLGGHSRAWQNPVEDRGDVLFIRIPEGAVCEGDAHLTLIAGKRDLIAERRYDELDFEVEL
ncbi:MULTISPECIES: DUF1963 domain-containing protein [unclassified Streptomyces]|uniref:DUF1963 domain-containing protein n=1 Tax=unclassified Streptomyces TaxID=2593676 RepID=UPI00278C8372|nr:MULTISPECIES: DUF1963 domain-containing protein [unclassified Streptomyces]